MVKQKVSLEIITPMFMGSSNPNEAELRAPSIKGVMRYFYRATMAEEVRLLRQKEFNLFGGVLESNAAIRAKVSIGVKPDSLNINTKNIKEEYKLSWHYDKDRKELKGDYEGIGYLFYSVVSGKSLENMKFIKTKGKFSLLFYGEPNSIDQYLATLWISVHFGGFGKRSRRGAGNVTFLTQPDLNNDLEFVIKGDSSEEIMGWLINNFQKARSILGARPAENPDLPYSNLNKAKIVISRNGFNDWQEALNDIGIKYMDFRTKNKDKIYEMAAFGIPIVHHSFNITATGIKRRSSPLIFKILKSGDNYYWMVVKLSGKFLPDLEDIKVIKEEKEEKKKGSRDNYKTEHKNEDGSYSESLLNEFLNLVGQDGIKNIL